MQQAGLHVFSVNKGTADRNCNPQPLQ